MKHLPNINCPRDIKALTPEELAELAAELRQEILGAVSDSGGHLASNLGAIELTLALHFVFDTPDDRLIWDVSHQTYAHKILTGRKDRIRTLRQYHGLAGFCKRVESEYDVFGAGHASTSISAALGFATARDMKDESHKTIAVIGDGAMTGGLAFEAMNNAGAQKKDLLVVLNDNTWSISKNVGAISKYLTSIMADEKFQKLRNEVWELTGKFKRRDRIRTTIQRLENSIKGFLVPGMLFEKFGFRYFGPIDGHDLPLLIKTLGDVKNLPGPIMLHVATVKGKGYAPSEEDANKFHGVGKFDKITGKAAPSAGLPSYTKVFGQTMIELAEKNDKVVAITAAMSSGTGLDAFAGKFPDRFHDVGIAEAHAACFAAGLAAEGIRPYLTVYSTFMQRAYDQVIHDMAVQNLPVVICMDRGGLVGNDGPTHHGVYDLAYMSAVPNVTIAAPKDGNELRAMLHHTVDNELPGITALRYPRGNVPTAMKGEVEEIEWGTWDWLAAPQEVVILAVGAMVEETEKTVAILDERGIHAAIVNARFVKPLDLKVLEEVRKNARVIVTAEDGALRGGFGQAVAEYLLARGYKGKFLAKAIPDRFVTHGGRNDLLKEINLDAASIAEAIVELVGDREDAGSEEVEAPQGFFKKLSLRRNGSSRKKEAVKGVPLTGTDPE
ncbi:MAG: 1-deoxy-D-xylulose-5-phosphate synthase [bacterium]|nr:1-deoxy-D-xylulose-5-phosphate synthase [bacterium]